MLATAPYLLFENDSMLAFISQQPQADTLFLIDACDGHEFDHFDLPITRQSIGGMGWNPINRLIYCGSAEEDLNVIAVIDPEDGSLDHTFDLAEPSDLLFVSGFATNGFQMLRSDGPRLELLSMNGSKLGERTYPGREINGISASPFSWTLVDRVSNEIIIIDALGNIIAVASAPGPIGGNPVQGSHSIVFDYINWPGNGPQLCIPNEGIPEEIEAFEGSPYDANAIWNPTPWQFKHKLYIANQTTNTILRRLSHRRVNLLNNFYSDPNLALKGN